MMEEDECRKVNMWKDTKHKNMKTIQKNIRIAIFTLTLLNMLFY